MFLLGGFLIYFATDPFVGSLFAISISLGVPSFVFIQWVAPFVSEFPEFLSTFYWARTVYRAPMALMNMVSSNINQWTLLTAMLPVVLSLGAGHVSSLPLDDQQKLEVLMTLGQQLVGMLFLINMELAWWEAASLFVLWFVQFVFSAIPPETQFWGPLATHVHFGSRWRTSSGRPGSCCACCSDSGRRRRLANSRRCGVPTCLAAARARTDNGNRCPSET